MEVFIAIGAAQLFYLMSFLLIKKKKQKADLILSSLLFFLGIGYTITYISYAYHYDQLRVFLWNFGMLVSPVLFFYALQLTKGTKSIKSIHFLHFLPWIITSIYLTVLMLTKDDMELVILFQSSDFIHKPISYLALFFAEIFVIPFYSILILQKIKKHKQKLICNYSYSEDIDLMWLKKMVIATFIIWIMIYIFYFCSSFKMISEAEGIKYGFVFGVIMILYLGHKGLRQKNVFFAVDDVDIDEEKADEPKPKYQKTGLSHEKSEGLMQQIENVMRTEKPYLNPKLNIQQLSKQTEISVHHLSQTLNDIAGQSFFGYINTFRVKEFIEKTEKNEHKTNTLLALAYDCGFNSKSSFNRIFKEVKGISPSEFIQKH